MCTLKRLRYHNAVKKILESTTQITIIRLSNCLLSGIIGNGYTPQNPKITFPVTCTINKDNDESHDQLDLVLSRQEIILDDSGITVNETSDNATARTIQFIANGVSDGTSLYCQLRKNGSRRAVLEVPIDLYGEYKHMSHYYQLFLC